LKIRKKKIGSERIKELKERLISSPILFFPMEDGQFILDTDASNHGIGAVLFQVQKVRRG